MTKDQAAALAAATDELVAKAAKQGTAAAAAAGSGAAERVPAPPLVHIRNTWIEELTARIRSRPIPWEGYQRADLVSADELKLIKKVDAKGNAAGRAGPSGEAAKIADSDSPEYALLYLRLLAKLSRTDTLQQILVLVGDMLTERDDRAQHFLEAVHADTGNAAEGSQQSATSALPWGPFLKLLKDAQDEFVQLKSAQFLILLLISDKGATAPSQALPLLTTFLSSLIHASAPSSSASSAGAAAGAGSSGAYTSSYADGNGADIAIQLLEALLRSPVHRRAIWEEEQRVQSEVPADAKGLASSSASTASSGPKRESIIHGLLNLLRTTSAASASALPSAANSKPGSGAVTPSYGEGSSTAVASSSASFATARAPAGAGVGPQLQYQTIFCIWLLTFDDEVAEELNVKFPIVPVLSEVAKSAIKEKVVRVVVATFRNLLQKAPAANAPALLGSKVLSLSESLAARKWSDEEINEDLDFIVEELKTKLQNMSTYDVYVSELASGQLTWDSPLHELDDFWRVNTPKLLENDAEQLKRLISILMESSDPVTLAVACSDLDRIVTVSEAAKKRVNESSAKVRIMELISHQDTDVKFRALNTVSKLISASWR